MDFKENISLQSIVRVPCPHCAHLCSSVAKKCPKCGEPLKVLKNTASKEKNLELIEEHESETLYIRQLEKGLEGKIPLVEKLKRNTTGYVKKSDAIIGLSLFKCNLAQIPPEVFKLKSLVKFYLRRNRIEEIPNLIDSLASLEILDVSLNRIEKIPAAIGFLSNLKMLNFSSNKLDFIPETLNSLKNLEYLYLNNNQLKNISIDINYFPSLKKIDTRGNLLLSHQTQTIPKKPKVILKLKKKQKSLEDFI